MTTNNVERLVAGMLALPLAALSGSFGALLAVVRAAQGGLVTGLESPEPTEIDPPCPARPAAPDLDLGGEDLKYVTYAILFTKPDYEAVLRQQADEVVAYATDGACFMALKVGELFEDIANRRVPRPPSWVATAYPPGSASDNATSWQIPAEDLKYVTLVYWVQRRLPRKEAEYQKSQTRSLRRIAEAI